MVDLPSLVRLSHARLVYKELRPMVKDRNWKLCYGDIMLKQGRSLHKTLVQLWDYVGELQDFLLSAIEYHARPMSMPQKHDDDDLPSLGVEEDDPEAAMAALLSRLSRVDGIVDDPAAAILRGIYGNYNNQGGSSRAAALRQILTEMEERFSVISGQAVWMTNHKLCEELALCGHKMISALGVLSSAPDSPGGPDTSESVAARLSRLQELKTVVWLFYEAIESVMYAPVSFNFRPIQFGRMSQTVRFPSCGGKCSFIEWSSEDGNDTDGTFGPGPAGIADDCGDVATFR